MSSVSDSTSYSNAAKRAQDSYESERAQSRANQENEINKLKEDQAEQQTRSREEYNSRLAQVRSEASDDIRKLKEEMYGRDGKKFQQDSRDLSQERNQIAQYKEQIDKNADRRVEQADRASHAQSLQSMQNEDRKVEEALAAQKRSHLDEINQLNDEMEIYKNHAHDINHEKAEARQETIQGFEAERLHDRDRVVQAYEQRINRLKEKGDEREHFYTRQLNDSTIEANERAKGQIRTQKDEFTRIDLNRRAEAKRLENYYEDQVKNERIKNARSENTLIQQSDEDRNRVVADKDQTYRSYIQQTSDVHRGELAARDAEISKLKTTGDVQKVSPFVVQKIRDEGERRHYANLKEEQNTNTKNVEALKKRDADERREIRDSNDQRYTNWNRTQQQQRDLEKRQFLVGYEDLKQTREEEQRQLRSQFTDQRERTHTQHAQDLDLQQRKFKDDLEVQRASMIDSKNNLVENLEDRQRGENREWFVRMNQLRRDYDRKFMDEHDQNERLVSELKFSFDKKLQDMDRLSKKALDDRVKSYEHQISQQEVAFKERERFLTEHYEEELDSMRRTNARLIQKKS
jgi:hypothetical protein